MEQKSNAPKIILLVIGGGFVAMLVCCGVAGLVVQRSIDKVAGVSSVPDEMTYDQWRSEFASNLTKRGPAPQEFDREVPPVGVEEILYPSGSLELKAWVQRPPNATEPNPALVFLHGGFAFGEGDLFACQAAIDRGYVVMAPMLRGENGNPGNFELFLGEVDDAEAAAVWLANQDYVDASRIYAFGHSVGGGVSALLSLKDSVPVQHTGSSGGLYPPTVFLGWFDIVPFEMSPKERGIRLLIGNIKHMQRPHFAYLGQQDSLGDAAAMARAEMVGKSELTIEMVPGNHFSSFDTALERYLDQIEGAE